MTTPPPRQKRCRLIHPQLTPYLQWPTANQGCLSSFRRWLRQTDCGRSTEAIYCAGVHKALAYLNKPYWQIDPEADLAAVQTFLAEHFESASTVAGYAKGLRKFAQYLRLRCHRPAEPRPVNWGYHLAGLPATLVPDIHAYLAHCRRNWPAEQQAEQTQDWLSHLTGMLRWLAVHAELSDWPDLTPPRWFAYVDQRLADGRAPATLNSDLSRLLGLLHWLADQGRVICGRMLKVGRLAEGPRLPKDVPPEQLARLLTAIAQATAATHAGVRRCGLLDRAWVLLMLHSGLRTGEVRRLRLTDLDWERRLVRIEQSKGLKDRLVPLSSVGIDALRAYLAVRGPADALPDNVFIYRHAPLTQSYCGQRLQKYYGRQIGLHITPHQLRHSCATLLLNAGAPVLTVQTILGHKQVDTTLGYARLYDGTVAADYYRAMAQVEAHWLPGETAPAPAPATCGELVALVDSLRGGTLNSTQAEVVALVRAGLMALAEQSGGPAVDS